MKNSDIIEIEITDVTNEAMGVGHFEGMAVFVPGAVRGDVLSVQITKLKKHMHTAGLKILFQNRLIAAKRSAPHIKCAAAAS